VTPTESLADLLAEAPRSVSEQAARAFDLARGGRAVVLVGAGNLGRRIATAMAAAGEPAIAFADGERALRDTLICDLPVLSVEEAVSSHPDAAFVVSIWGARSAHRIAETEARLRDLGAGCLIPFAHLLWKLRETLPHYCIDFPEGVAAAADRVMAALALLSDDASRERYVEEIRARLTGRFDRLSPPVANAQYLVDDLYAWRPDEVVFDGGAFDGDTLRDWLRAGRDFARWIAIEPDPANADRFVTFAETLPDDTRSRIRLLRNALGAAAGTTGLVADGPSTRVDSDVAGGVPVATIDAISAAARPSFIKLDIEGAEPAALVGGAMVIERDRPVLAICVYHRLDHIWEVPLQIAALYRDADFFLRPHGAEGWDLVLYVVPRERRR
jgi:FkbM family methyltransferase